jgi:hypothetical protein
MYQSKRPNRAFLISSLIRRFSLTPVQLDATVAATRAQMARLEAQVAQARAAHRTELERMEVVLFRWRVAVTALHGASSPSFLNPRLTGTNSA